MKRFAVIDLGTNTFHILIAGKKDSDDFIVVYRERAFVKLAEEGINNIGKHAFKRGLEALKKFRDIMDLFEVIDYRAVATAAMRNADNAPIFIERSRRSANINIEVISGNREAALIYGGVKHAGILSEETSMIMDIGGGSVEFIIGNQHNIFWAHSFDIGAAVLKHRFHNNEPISLLEKIELQKFLKDATQLMIPKLQQYAPRELIGASGTFDVLAENLSNKLLHVAYPMVTWEDFKIFCNQVVSTTHEERLAMPGIPESRADLMVVALLLIDFILELTKPERIKISNNALKEGMIAEMIQNYNTSLK
jgi:exopolyphosphatase/guanosine-5'-triphosphate,3'-diphosphate pyrophosphatase